MRDKRQLLLIPMSLNIGVMQGFVMGDFTKWFGVSCWNFTSSLVTVPQRIVVARRFGRNVVKFSDIKGSDSTMETSIQFLLVIVDCVCVVGGQVWSNNPEQQTWNDETLTMGTRFSKAFTETVGVIEAGRGRLCLY
ncbi:hypothetical protein AVEN_39859-1 [Araneus ventricosus]|uniref:Uncharacterized protein n=1 Tax=Araneus ventricosus TaxID=182803 RepID=A0A4Y2GTV3_ARAVE|nr:hypothetical protein AVEN_192218-1 [Araneus ventricosus]GBM56991.1 hypothetical protein AVEN_39859-1 [Araneus ventricosus]